MVFQNLAKQIEKQEKQTQQDSAEPVSVPPLVCIQQLVENNGQKQPHFCD